MQCEVFKITNTLKDERLDIQYTACSNGLSAGHSISAGGSVLLCSYAHPYITNGQGSISVQPDHELVGIGAPNK